MIIALLQLKGGSGKSSLALGLAGALAASRGARVVVIDADVQGSLTDWAAARTAPPVFDVRSMAAPNLHRELAELAPEADFIIIDTPPRVAEVARSALMASDMVLMPVQPSPLDVWALSSTIELVSEARELRPRLAAAIVMNRKVVNTAIGRDVHEALAEFGIPVMQTVIHQRVIHAEAAAEGLTVIEAQPKGLAAEEIRALAREIKSMMRGRK